MWLIHGQKYADTDICPPYVFAERVILTSQALICSYNSLQSLGERISTRCWAACRDLLPFSHKSISEVRQRCSEQPGPDPPHQTGENRFFVELSCTRPALHCRMSQTQTVTSKFKARHCWKRHCTQAKDTLVSLSQHNVWLHIHSPFSSCVRFSRWRFEDAAAASVQQHIRPIAV